MDEWANNSLRLALQQIRDEATKSLHVEIEHLRSLVDDQLRTIKALTHGCEAYGLTETTPIVRHMAAQDAEIERLTTELAVERKRSSSYRTLVSSLESQISRHRANASEAAEAIRTLDSERAANATLTAELATCRSKPQELHLHANGDPIDCRTCVHMLDGLRVRRRCALNVLPTPIVCIGGDAHVAMTPVRLYETGGE